MKRLAIIMMVFLTSFVFIGCDFFNISTSSTESTTQTTTQSSSTSSELTTDSTGTTTSTDTTTTQLITEDEFTPFVLAVNNFNMSNVFGHLYEKQQMIDEFVIYSETQNVQMVSKEPLLVKLSYLEYHLADFDSDTQFVETEYDIFYNNNVATKVEDGNETILDQEFRTLAVMIDIASVVDKSVLSDWAVNGNVLTLTLTDEYAETLFEGQISEIEIAIIITGTDISSIKISYNFEGYTFYVNHQFIYEAHSIEIMEGHISS